MIVIIRFHCDTCFPQNEGMGCCECCAKECHIEHKLSKRKLYFESNCGCAVEGKCKILKDPPQIQLLPPNPNQIQDSSTINHQFQVTTVDNAPTSQPSALPQSSSDQFSQKPQFPKEKKPLQATELAQASKALQVSQLVHFFQVSQSVQPLQRPKSSQRSKSPVQTQEPIYLGDQLQTHLPSVSLIVNKFQAPEALPTIKSEPPRSNSLHFLRLTQNFQSLNNHKQ